ncbi:hypothetical protein WICPIJ_001939 [Wickerhamomyces pijperi]|uniref:Uncharacterized protein n=1 Tax=Wickerhamomyces pijperi TaxID=599730 RepID=A0A9P8TQN3_WICPI|nr:hypothetical protein WICPIJ_001939 [Wickerhamomyces pijperi]
MLRIPRDRFVTNEQWQDTFQPGFTNQLLNVWSQSERNSFRVEEHRSSTLSVDVHVTVTGKDGAVVGFGACQLGWQHLVSADGTRLMIDKDLGRNTVVNGHHVSHEDERSVLRGELLTEQPEVFKPSVQLGEVVLEDGVWNDAGLQPAEDLHLDAGRVWNRNRQGQLDVSLTSLDLLIQNVIQDTIQLEDSLLTTGMTNRWELDGKHVQTTVMASDGQSLVTGTGTTDQFQSRQESFNLDEMAIVVLVEEILAWNFDIFKLLVVEFTQMRTQTFQIDKRESSIQLGLQAISPFA